MSSNTHTPLIVQSDGSLLLDVHDPGFAAARDDIAPLRRTREITRAHAHLPDIPPLPMERSLIGLGSETIENRLARWSRFAVPENILFSVRDLLSRYGSIVLKESDHPRLFDPRGTGYGGRTELTMRKEIAKYLIPDGGRILVPLIHRGSLKSALIKIDYPVKDLATLNEGESIDIRLRRTTREGRHLPSGTTRKRPPQAFTEEERRATDSGSLFFPAAPAKPLSGSGCWSS